MTIREPDAFIIDMASLGVVVGAIMQILPPLTAFLSLIWVGFRLYETWLRIQMLKKGKDPDK